MLIAIGICVGQTSSAPTSIPSHPASGFDELLASVGLSLMDEDYPPTTPAPTYASIQQQNPNTSSVGMTVRPMSRDPFATSTAGLGRVEPPVQPGGSAISAQPAGTPASLVPGPTFVVQPPMPGGATYPSGPSTVASVNPSPSTLPSYSEWPQAPRSSFAASQPWGSYGAVQHQQSWFRGAESLTPASSLAFEEDAAWSSMLASSCLYFEPSVIYSGFAFVKEMRE